MDVATNVKDNEIIKALECCSSGDYKSCKKCPLFENCNTPIYQAEIIMKNGLDLINRQKSEINVKRKLLEKAEETINRQQAEIEELKIINEHLATFNIENEAESKEWHRTAELNANEIIKLQAEIERLHSYSTYKHAQAEAIKEFAERAKQKGIIVKGGKGYEGVNVFVTNLHIDNLAKEMVGDTE